MQAFQRGFRRAAVAAALIGVCSLAASAVEIVVLSTAQEEAPGAFVTHVFAVTNDGPTDDTFALSFEAPPGWGVLGASDSIGIATGSEETLFVTLTIPPGTLAGEYEVALSATSEDDPSLTATASALVIVTPTREIELLPPDGAGVVPGGSVEYELVLINRGNAQDSFSIEASSSKRLPLSLSPTAVDLAPQEQVTIRVRLDVPAGASPGSDVLTVIAISTLYESVETEAVISTTVLPPGPEGVGRSLMEVLPARIRLSLDKDVLSGEFSSRLTFSVSGQIVGGFFSSNLSLSDPLGPDPLELGSFSILYRRTPTTYTIGNVSQRLSDLIRLSCRGGSAVIDEELFDLRIIGGGSADETRFAGRLTLGPDEVNLGLAYLGIRDPSPTYESVWSAIAEAEPLEDWTILIEGALGIAGSLSSRAVFFDTEIDTSGFFFSGSAYSVGTHFPGSNTDSAGIEASYRLRLTALSLSLSMAHVWDNVIRDPLVDTRIEDELGFNLRATPLEDGPTLSATANFTWDRYSDLAAKSELDTLLALAMTESGGVFPYSVTGKITDQIDHVLGTHVRRATYSEGAGLSVDSFYLYLQLTQEKQVDLIQDIVLSSSSDVSLRFRPEGTLHEASIAFRNTIDEFDLSASLYIRFVEDLDIVFDGSISWDRVDSSSVSFGWGISLNASLDIPLPFFVTKGQIEGRAFIDRDGDRAYGIEDRPADGITVAANGEEVSTNADGLFRFTPFYPDTYMLSVSRLPDGAASADPIAVDLAAGGTVWVDVPLTPVVALDGRLFDDRDQDGVEDADEGGFEKVRVLLSDGSGLVADAYTDLAGSYSFPNVWPGDYTITFDVGTLPDRFVFTTAAEAAVAVGAEAPPAIVLGGFVRPREVIVTFQPPTADFVFSPDTPVAGEPVAFDGTYSFDFDGEIVSYAWDFDGDGAADAVEAVTQYAFPESGTYEVSLTVVDNSENSDTITLPIDVREETVQPIGVSTFQPPVADFAFMPAAPVAGEAVRFDGTLSGDFDGEIVSYVWDFDGDGTIDATTAVADHAYLQPGTYSVSLTVTDDAGNADTVTLSIVIGGEPAEGAADEATTGFPVAAFQRPPVEPIAGEPVRFNGTLSVDPDGQIVGFAWDFDGDGNADSTAPLAEYTFAGPGAYMISLTVTDNDGNTDTIVGTIIVAAPPEEIVEPHSIQPPVADFAYMPASPSPGDSVLFNGTFSSDFDGEVISFAWDFDGDGTIDSTNSVAEHSFSEAGTYAVSLTVTDDGGNTDTLTIPIDVE